MIFVTTASAACPVCIVGVGGGLIIAEWLGIDDLLVSIWIMGLMCATSFWFAGWLEKKMGEKIIAGKKILTNGYAWSVLMFLLVIAYFIGAGKLGYKYIWGFDRLIVGSIMGTIAFFMAQLLEKFLRKKNEGKVYFPFQKVVLPIGALIVMTLLGFVFLKVGGVI